MRKAFLIRLCQAVTFMLVGQTVPAVIISSNLPPHPRLMLSVQELPAILERTTDGTWVIRRLA
jgi:hypothetical protein